MPLFTTSLQSQEQAASSGILTYPSLDQLRVNGKISDSFERLTLNPTNAIALYSTTSNDGNAAFTIISTGFRLTTDSSAAGDDASVILNELRLSRIRSYVDTRSQLEIDILFSLVDITDTEGFIGIQSTNTPLAALPTTAAHFGIYWDKSAQANYFLSSADGTTQATTNTGLALTTGRLRLNIIWNGQNSVTLKLFNGTGFLTEVSSQTVTALGQTTDDVKWFMVYLVQTETTAAKSVAINEWSISAT